MKYEEMSQGEPSGGGPSPSNKSPMIQTGSLAEEMNTALETADLDSNPTLLCTSSVSLGVSLLASEPRYLYQQNEDNHARFIGLCVP